MKSRLEKADSPGDRRLRAHLRELVDPKIAEHYGRIVKNTSAFSEVLRGKQEPCRSLGMRKLSVPSPVSTSEDANHQDCLPPVRTQAEPARRKPGTERDRLSLRVGHRISRSLIRPSVTQV